MARFFISYTGIDVSWAHWIAQVLDKAGHETIYQARDFRPGQDFMQRMEVAAEHCDAIIPVFSGAYFGSDFAMLEMRSGIADDPSGKKIRVIPVRVEKVKIPRLYQTRIYIDLSDLDDAEVAAQRLLNGLSEETGRAAGVSFPGKASGLAPASLPRLPPIFEPGARPNPFFGGRTNDLDRVRTRLSRERAASTVAIVGLSGVGKTSLAIEYAHAYGSTYAGVWRVRAERIEDILQDLMALSERLGLAATRSMDVRQTARAALARINESERPWLILYDNVPESYQTGSDAGTSALRVLPEFLPATGHVLITSRRQHWGPLAEPIEITSLTGETSTAFLLHRAASADEVGAAALAERLDGLPLALEMAAAYVATRACPFRAYIERFDKNDSGLFAYWHEDSVYPRSAAQAIALSLREVTAHPNHGKSAEDTLTILAFLGADRVPAGTLIGGAREKAETMVDGLALLRGLSLIRMDTSYISVHRAVQAVVRALLSPADRSTVIAAALKRVTNAFPAGNRPASDPASWPVCADLCPHALSVLEYADALPELDDASDRLSNQVAIYSYARGDYAAAARLLDRAARTCERHRGLDDPETATRLNNLAVIRRTNDQHDAALTAIDKALEIRERLFGRSHALYAISLNVKGSILEDQAQLAEAEACYQQALEISERTLAKSDATLLIRMNNLARTYTSLGKFDEAEVLYDRALSSSAAELPEARVNLAAIHKNKASLYEQTNRYREAEDAYSAALKVQDAIYESDHPQIADSLFGLSLLQAKTARVEQAIETMQRAVSIRRKQLGPGHRKTSDAESQLARLQLLRGN